MAIPGWSPCCCPRASRGTRCARTSSWPPGWPRPGRVPRSPASPTTARPAAARPSRPGCPPTGGVMLEVILRLIVIVAVFMLLPLIIGQAEHKIMGHMQSRLGPMYAGFHGVFQLVADGIKFMQKEDV